MKVITIKDFNVVDLPAKEEVELIKAFHAKKVSTVKIHSNQLNEFSKIGREKVRYYAQLDWTESFVTKFNNALAGIDEALKVKKIIRYESAEKQNSFLSLYEKSKNDQVGFRQWKKYYIPVLSDFTFVQEDFNNEAQAKTKERLKKWNYLDDNCSFLYSGVPRGLYPSFDSKRIKGGRGITKGDVVMIIDHKLRLSKPPYSWERAVDLYFSNMNCWHFQYIAAASSIGSWDLTKVDIFTSKGFFTVGGGVYKRAERDNPIVNGMIQVLAGGTSGWMKITAKSLSQFEKDFVKDGTPEYKALLEETAYKDKRL